MTDKESHISEIVDRLDSLTLEANMLTRELPTLRTPDVNPTHIHANPTHIHNFKKEDKVIIKKGYLGKRGTEGIVTYNTKTRVTLRDGSGKTHTRKFTNVSKAK
jgi:hypothetical protein